MQYSDSGSFYISCLSIYPLSPGYKFFLTVNIFCQCKLSVTEI